MIEIQKNVPIPKTTRGNRKYPWEQMEIGDSFFIETPTRASSVLAGSANQRFKDKRFVSIKEGTGRRIWRIA